MVILLVVVAVSGQDTDEGLAFCTDLALTGNVPEEGRGVNKKAPVCLKGA